MPDRLHCDGGHEQFRHQLTEAGRIGGCADPLVVELRLLNLMYLAVHQVLTEGPGPLGPKRVAEQESEDGKDG